MLKEKFLIYISIILTIGLLGLFIQAGFNFNPASNSLILMKNQNISILQSEIKSSNPGLEIVLNGKTTGDKVATFLALYNPGFKNFPLISENIVSVNEDGTYSTTYKIPKSSKPAFGALSAWTYKDGKIAALAYKGFFISPKLSFHFGLPQLKGSVEVKVENK